MRARGRGLGTAAAIVVALVWTLPLTGVLITAVRPADTAATDGWWRVVTDPSLTLDNVQAVLGGQGPVRSMWSATLSSVAISVPATLLVVGVGLLTASAIAWTDLPGRRAVHLVAVGALFVPVQALLVPLVTAYDDTGLRGTLPGLWLAHLALGLPLAVVLLTAAVRTVPTDLVDAARTDGAGHLDILRRVVAPLAAPAIAAVALFQFLLVWNDLLVAASLLGDPRGAHAPLPLVLADIVRTWPNSLHLHGAAALVTIAVPLVVFAVLHRLLTSVLGAAANGPGVVSAGTPPARRPD